MKIKTNPHAWFFAYVKNLEGYNQEYAKVIREGIILEYTDGLTGSLSELYSQYPGIYKRMKAELCQESANEMDKARKRLIAVLYAYLKDGEKNPSMQYVKSVACNAAKVSQFNDISLNELKSLYRIFGTKNTKGLSEVHRNLVWGAMRKENRY